MAPLCCLCSLVVLLATPVHARSCGIARGSHPVPVAPSCLRLRGGFFKLPAGPARGGGETATAEDFEDEHAATPATEKAATEAAPGQETGAATPAQLTVQQHVAEYALAGSLDGLRTGLGQSVGGQVNVFVSAALQSTAKAISFAFASAICAYRERQVSLPVDL